MHCICPLMLSITCLPCTLSVHSCCPSAVYRALGLFTRAVHLLSTVHYVCSLMLSISCLPCTVSVHSCCLSAVYRAMCLFTYAVYQLSSMHCIMLWYIWFDSSLVTLPTVLLIHWNKYPLTLSAFLM